MLGLDVGERWIGVAVSEGRIAVPLTIIESEGLVADIGRIAAMVRAEGAEAVVVGLPVSLSGEEHAQALLIREFGEELADAIGVPVVYQDERLTSRQVAGAAGRRMAPKHASRVHPARRRGKARVDDLAATVILQAYIDALHSTEHPG